MIICRRNSLFVLFHILVKRNGLEIYKNKNNFFLKTFFEFNKKKFISKNSLGLIFLIAQRILLKKNFFMLKIFLEFLTEIILKKTQKHIKNVFFIKNKTLIKKKNIFLSNIIKKTFYAVFFLLKNQFLNQQIPFFVKTFSDFVLGFFFKISEQENQQILILLHGLLKSSNKFILKNQNNFFFFFYRYRCSLKTIIFKYFACFNYEKLLLPYLKVEKNDLLELFIYHFHLDFLINLLLRKRKRL
jgi:hypothetical protein